MCATNNMAYLFLLITAAWAFTAHCAVLNQDVLKRVARSPHCPECNSAFPPPPPPDQPLPPPFQYRSQQWSGLARDSYGAPRGVYSGSAAALGNTQSSGQAYSIAAAAAGSEDEGQSQIQGVNKFEKFNGNEQVPLAESHGGSIASGKVEGHQELPRAEPKTGAQSAAFSSSQDFHQQAHPSFNNKHEELKPASFHKFEGTRGDQGQQQQLQENNFDRKAYNSFGHDADAHSFSHGEKLQNNPSQDLKGKHSQLPAFDNQKGNLQTKDQAAFRAKDQQQHVSNQWSQGRLDDKTQKDNLQTQNALNVNDKQQQVGWNQAGEVQTASSGHGDIQATLSGALNLAAQGLQTPCATCGKGGYALSNARSHSGDAVALSIGG